MKNSRREILIGVEILLLSLIFVITGALSIYASNPTSNADNTVTGIIEGDGNDPNQEVQIVQTFDPERQRFLIRLISWIQIALAALAVVGAVYLIFG